MVRTEAARVNQEGYPKPQDTGNTSQSPEQAAGTCRICGMPHAEWPSKEGYSKNGEVYCCAGCAEGKGCTCSEPAEKQGLVEENAGLGSRNASSVPGVPDQPSGTAGLPAKSS
jgi:hypothetical protein